MDAHETPRALLLAGGLGSRLQPITESIPKCMIEIGGYPLLAWWIEKLTQSGVRDAVVNTHHLPWLVREFLRARGVDSPLHVSEAFEAQLLGSAGTISANLQLADATDCVAVIYVDNVSDIDLAHLIEFHRKQHLPGTVVLFHAQNPKACGIASLDDAGRIVEFVEKPETPKSNLANAGIYVFDSDLYREIGAMWVRDLGHDALPRLVGRLSGYLHHGYHRDIGTHESLHAARMDFAAGLVATRGFPA